MEIKSHFGYGGTIHNFKNYVLRGNEKYYKRLDDNFNNLNNAIQTYLSLDGITAEERQVLSAIESVARNYHSQSEIAHKLIAQGKTAQEVDAIVKVSDKPVFEAFKVLDKVYQELTEKVSSRLSDDINHTVNSSVWISVFLIILVSISLLLIIRVITQRIGIIRSELKNIETNNDLCVRLDTSTNDENSDLSSSVNALLERFSGMINDIIRASVDVGVESSNQSVIVEQTVKGVHQQHKKIELVTQLMNNMSETVQNVSINAEQAVSAAELANSGIDRGGEQMRRLQGQVASAVKVMDDSRNDTGKSFKQATETGNTLNEVTEDIQKMSQAMEQIARISGEQFKVSMEMNEHIGAI